jgi:hypothetical protein
MALAAQAGSPDPAHGAERRRAGHHERLRSKAFLLRRQGANIREASTRPERYIRAISAPFGPHSDAQWRFLTETWLRRNDDGTWRAHLRPAHRRAAPRAESDLELWSFYDAVRCPDAPDARRAVRSPYARGPRRRWPSGAARRRWWRNPAASGPTRRRCCSLTDRRGARLSFSREPDAGRAFRGGSSSWSSRSYLPVPAGAQSIARPRAKQGLRAVWASMTGLAGFSLPTRRACGAASTSTSAARRGGGAGRRRQGALHALTSHSASPRSSRARSDMLARNTDLDAHARHEPRTQLRRRQLLRRPGLHGPPQAEREEREGAERGHRYACSRGRPTSSTWRITFAPTA